MRGRTINRERLQTLRAQAGLRVNQLAARIGCSDTHLYHVLSASPSKSGKLIELGDILIYKAADVLSEELGREVTINDFTDVYVDERAAS
jgi:transcriptional regulator with XRE-family HTH domain